MRIKPQQPDHRYAGNLQFVTGWTHSGAEMCVHLSLAEYKKRIEAKCGPGALIEENGVFYWEATTTQFEDSLRAKYGPGVLVEKNGVTDWDTQTENPS